LLVPSLSSGPGGRPIVPLVAMPLPPVPTPTKSGSMSPALAEPGPESAAPTPWSRLPSCSQSIGWVAPGSARFVFSFT
jgi:hypothetical protein